ncbi:unnamed protein product [Vitrella brassicaformis CCMP3155]|uniref:Prolyl 4-hydroxylase alpha subunit Fe(2+) 2OG dioxygenase domain-containing protein n=1 Tax=Vitrella brassicaformis (strain CCMP3155) TaxID=1169540 RepID=A0A0G4GV06_VITBC|nr:unnamed protein product [Vitrella brassicaformis CCMP3155]|eukprot:CEM34728.1 unnamed protein product [Vitrella brassicaformis CCMP3155]
MSPSRDFSCFSSVITEDKIAHLVAEGFAIIDGCFSHEWATALRKEAVWLMESGLLIPNRTKFGQALLTKPNVYELDLHGEARSKVPEFDALWASDALVEALSCCLKWLGSSVELLKGTEARSIKIQCNRGSGGCFPFHYDNAGPPCNRKVTCLVYLNPDWQEGDGGEIVLLPFLKEAVVVPPLMARMVIFWC